MYCTFLKGGNCSSYVWVLWYVCGLKGKPGRWTAASRVCASYCLTSASVERRADQPWVTHELAYIHLYSSDFPVTPGGVPDRHGAIYVSLTEETQHKSCVLLPGPSKIWSGDTCSVKIHPYWSITCQGFWNSQWTGYQDSKCLEMMQNLAFFSASDKTSGTA